jgi:hypothetical protein
MLYVDIPNQKDLLALIGKRSDAAVSFYIRTTPETQNIGAARTTLGNLLKEAEQQLADVGTPKRTVWPISEQVADLLEDDDFWAHQANSLAVFVTPGSIRTFRLPNHLTDMVQVSDRFHVKPLLRSLSVQNHAFVLALTENGVRLIEVFADLPAQEVRVPEMPKDAASAAGTASVNSRSYSGRIGGGEGQNSLLRAYCRKVDAALRPVLSGRSEPLIIAATDPLLSLFRSVSSHDTLLADAIHKSPAHSTPAELAAEARPMLDTFHAQVIAAVGEAYQGFKGQGRATTDIAVAARAATFGAVDTLLVDIDEALPGTVDEQTGAVSHDENSSAASYGIVDEIAGRVILTGGKVLAVRRDDIPENGSLAAILRYPV